MVKRISSEIQSPNSCCPVAPSVCFNWQCTFKVIIAAVFQHFGIRLFCIFFRFSFDFNYKSVYEWPEKAFMLLKSLLEKTRASRQSNHCGIAYTPSFCLPKMSQEGRRRLVKHFKSLLTQCANIHLF